jgi:hypothetical protein
MQLDYPIRNHLCGCGDARRGRLIGNEGGDPRPQSVVGGLNAVAVAQQAVSL